jgi:hypothetical protein
MPLPNDEYGLHAVQFVVVSREAVFIREQVGSILPLVEQLHVLEECGPEGVPLLGHQHYVGHPVRILVVEALRDSVFVIQVELVQRALFQPSTAGVKSKGDILARLLS